MHFTALLTLVAALIPAVISVPAPSPQSAEIDVHLELKDVVGFFNERKAKTIPHQDANAPPGPTLPYPFFLKGHLLQGLDIIGPLPPLPYYQFLKDQLGEQGILSKQPTTFKLQGGKLLLGNKAVGLGPFEKRPIPAVLVHPQQGLNFTTTHQIGSEITTLVFVDPRFTFLGPKFVSGIGDRVEVGLRPPIWPHPTIITWEVVRTGPRDNSEDKFANKVSFEAYDQEVFAEDSIHDEFKK